MAGSFEELAGLMTRARRRLSDYALAPRLRLPWGPQEEFFGRN
ncbi:MAG TPA: hypothetical protein VFR69_11855 [Rubrobacteraceae bacterium]|nr:hypothetical protein [Rubrobacteraceae bacterium]